MVARDMICCMVSFERDVTVEWGECDPFGLIYFPNILAWFNDTEHTLFAEAGYSVNRMVEEKTAFVMGRVSFEFVGPVTFGQAVTTVIEIKELGNSSVTWSCLARRKMDGVTITEGTATRVYAEILADGSLKAQPIPPALRAVFEQGLS